MRTIEFLFYFSLSCALASADECSVALKAHLDEILSTGKVNTETYKTVQNIEHFETIFLSASVEKDQKMAQLLKSLEQYVAPQTYSSNYEKRTKEIFLELLAEYEKNPNKMYTDDLLIQMNYKLDLAFYKNARDAYKDSGIIARFDSRYKKPELPKKVVQKNHRSKNLVKIKSNLIDWDSDVDGVKFRDNQRPYLNEKNPNPYHTHFGPILETNVKKQIGSLDDLSPGLSKEIFDAFDFDFIEFAKDYQKVNDKLIELEDLLKVYYKIVNTQAEQLRNKYTQLSSQHPILKNIFNDLYEKAQLDQVQLKSIEKKLELIYADDPDLHLFDGDLINTKQWDIISSLKSRTQGFSVEAATVVKLNNITETSYVFSNHPKASLLPQNLKDKEIDYIQKIFTEGSEKEAWGEVKSFPLKRSDTRKIQEVVEQASKTVEILNLVADKKSVELHYYFPFGIDYEARKAIQAIDPTVTFVFHY